MNMVASICISNYFVRVAVYGIIVKSMLTSAVHRKALRLSGASMQQFGSGKVMNMISTGGFFHKLFYSINMDMMLKTPLIFIDLSRIERFVVTFHHMWTFALQIIYIVSFLLHVMGPSALAGVALLVAMGPLQARVIRVLVRLRKENAKNTDQRVKLTSETLGSIRVIKFFAWVSNCCLLFIANVCIDSGVLI
jgi:ABC-type multidrug transport system fused ATPase/permease subunit